MSEQHESDPNAPVHAAIAAPPGRYLRRSFLLGAAAAGAGAAAGLTGLDQADAAPLAPPAPPAADRKSGYVAEGGGQVDNGFGTAQPPNVNLATGVNVWGNEAGVVGNGPTGVRATGVPIVGEGAIGLQAEAKTTGSGVRAKAVGVQSDAAGVSPMTIGVDSTATSTSDHPQSVAIGMMGAARTKKGIATGVLGTASTASLTEPATGVAGSVVAAGAPGIGVSGIASTEFENTSVTGVSGTANSLRGSASAIGVSAVATTGDKMSPATGVKAHATGETGWGISATGPKGGLFASNSLSAQLSLEPQETGHAGATEPAAPTQFTDPGAVLPQAGDVGDLWFTVAGPAFSPQTATLWICVRAAIGTAPAHWCQVLLGKAVPGQATQHPDLA